jgi:hypothetical protein
MVFEYTAKIRMKLEKDLNDFLRRLKINVGLTNFMSKTEIKEYPDKLIVEYDGNEVYRREVEYKDAGVSYKITKAHNVFIRTLGIVERV